MGESVESWMNPRGQIVDDGESRTEEAESERALLEPE